MYGECYFVLFTQLHRHCSDRIHASEMLVQAQNSPRISRFLHCIKVIFALPDLTRSYKRVHILPKCSNYVPNIVAEWLHFSLGIELCPVYVTINHVSLLSHSDIHSFFLLFVTTHMAIRHLQYLVSNGKAATCSGQTILHPRFSLQLLSGW